MNNTTENASDKEPVPTTPSRRASYLSPTKASLARSHPDILAKSPKKGSLTEPRGRLLRQELLGSRREQDSVDDHPVPKTAPRPARTIETKEVGSNSLNGSDKEGFAEAIARSFQDATPNRPYDENQPQPTARSPLHTRQAPGVSTGKRARNDKEESLSVGLFPVPKLMKKPEAHVRQKAPTADEPELPPTPVQLGLGPAPDRPRGLASSSSAGSRSGSGKHRQRVRIGGSTAIISSPLKPKHQGRISLPVVSDTADFENEVDEAPESDVEDAGTGADDKYRPAFGNRDENQLPATIRDKESKLSRLHSELKRLRQDLGNLGKLADDLQKDTIPTIPESVLHSLQPMKDSRVLDLQSPETHPSFVKDPSAYLKLFAPASLSLSHKTIATTVKRKPHLVHELDISATSPWPTDALKLCFKIEIDAECSSMQKVDQVENVLANPHERLQRWINDRLGDDMHRYDIGSIIWGAGQYFQACVTRAKAFKKIDERSKGGGAAQLLLNPKMTRSEETLLYPYLHRSQHKVLSANAATLPAGSDDSAVKQLLLTYDIELTWTGNARSNVDITLAGITGKAQKNAKELFAKLVDSEGVVGAFEAVYNLLMTEEKDHEMAPPKRSVGRPKKALNVS